MAIELVELMEGRKADMDDLPITGTDRVEIELCYRALEDTYKNFEKEKSSSKHLYNSCTRNQVVS